MTNSMKEALDAAKKAHDESFDGISHDCFHKGWQAATASADAKYLPVVERLVAIVNQQAEDEGLWFVAQYASEGYLQKELRLLHAAIEELAKPLLEKKVGV